MKTEEAAQFLSMMQLCHNVEDLTEAIEVALTLVPKVDEMTWLGEVADGTFYADSSRSRWFPQLTPREAMHIMLEEIL